MLGLFGAALAGSCSWPGLQHVVLASSREKIPTLLQKLPLPHPWGWQSSQHSPGHSVPGMERDCRVTPEKGMPTSTAQRSHQSRAPGESTYTRKGSTKLLLESSSCCSLSPRSCQQHYTADASHGAAPSWQQRRLRCHSR